MRRRPIYLLLLALLLQHTVLLQPAWCTLDAPAKQEAATPKGLYHHVWQLINDRFYDPTYNGQRWARWEHRYDGQLKTLEDARKAIETMLASLGDRYTRYLDPTAFDDEKQQIESKLSGIGIQMGLSKTSKLIVIAPIEGTPAANAGIMSQDQIDEIDGKSTNGMSVEQASKLIRGKVGTDVHLVVMRGNERKEFTITRDEIPIRSVQTVKMLNNDIGYVHLSTFMSERANDEMLEALDKLSPARGIIIDLRNNPGGLVTNALDICSMFLDGGIIVSTIDREGHVQSARANRKPISHQPLVVLINGGSASAAEITSGALHDSKRAELVGEKSFGKGLVQSITRLEDGSGVNITIARYVTPNNTDIHKKGIVPDYDVDLKAEDYKDGRGPWFIYAPNGIPAQLGTVDTLKDTQLKKAVEVLEHDMATAAAPESSPFQLKLNPFPNSLPVNVGIGVGSSK